MESTANERVRLLRKTIGISQQVFGECIDVSLVQMTRIEKGDAALKPVYVDKICKYFKCDANWLLNGVGELVYDYTPRNEVNVSWKDEAYRQLQQQNEFLQRMLDKLIGSPNFLNDIVCANAEMRRNIVSIAA